jgi:predicted AAA+ superfamily ATPase
MNLNPEDFKFPKVKIYERKVKLKYQNTLIVGPKGVGKTFLILDFLKKFKGKFIYIDLDDVRYAGSRLPIEGGEVRLLNDDEVLGTIENPESVLHHI